MFHFWHSEKRLQERLEAYLGQVAEGLRRLREIFPKCLDGTLAARSDLQNPVHPFESAADDMRRALEADLISGKLLPDARAEMLALVEAIDRIPNGAEDIVDLFAVQGLSVPAQLHADVGLLLDKSLEASVAMAETVRMLLQDVRRVPDLVAGVDQLESQVDRLERHLLHRLFQLDIELAHKLHLRDLVRNLAGIADKAENVADRVQWMAARRRP
jgi:predicted phosphate transport protein (TIGR00153 family)